MKKPTKSELKNKYNKSEYDESISIETLNVLYDICEELKILNSK